ncbi:hypothetical protein [Desulfospira joergensenii]|uniref:hypothetical protein n=1 Tax=Desulfospira joergensenii TaxID=53329 RepID=UPI0003B65417|nr:hypothetical protein [Desulfospira joergensenii]
MISVTKKIILIGCLTFLAPVTSYSWFSIRKEPPPAHQLEIPEGSSETISKHYVLSYNTKYNNRESFLITYPKGKVPIAADLIDIDIPLNVLTKEGFDPTSSLDRQIAANLRIRSILEEYLALKKRTRFALKHLNISSFETEEKKKPQAQEKIQNLNTLKILEKKLEALNLYSIGYLDIGSNQSGKKDDILIAFQNFKKKEASVADSEQVSNRLEGDDEYRKPSSQRVGNSHASELPWIFSFILGIARYAYSNKLEIILWSGVIVIASLIVTLVIKK